MRRGFDGLSAQVQTVLEQQPFSGHVFVLREEDGAIRVRRKGEAPSLGDVKLAFEGLSSVTRKELWNTLMDRKEVAEWMASSHCSKESFMSGKEFVGHNDAIGIEAGELTVAQLLDQIVAKSGVNFWAILQSRSGQGCTVDVMAW